MSLLFAAAAVLTAYSPAVRCISVPPRAALVARATGVMQESPPLGTRSAIPVSISVTGFNSRMISANVIVGAPPEAVWAILTDYDNLARHVPNLVTSELRPHPKGGIRLFQEGAQKIAGFDFRASLTMDMRELKGGENEAKGMRRIEFSLVDSSMFAAFEGEWRVQPYSRTPSHEEPGKFEYTSKLSYVVDITPRGLVPVPALEWRIREDVPVNLVAVKVAAQRLHAAQQKEQQR